MQQSYRTMTEDATKFSYCKICNNCRSGIFQNGNNHSKQRLFPFWEESVAEKYSVTHITSYPSVNHPRSSDC